MVPRGANDVPTTKKMKETKKAGHGENRFHRIKMGWAEKSLSIMGKSSIGFYLKINVLERKSHQKCRRPTTSLKARFAQNNV
jgi:hypothetical protein